VKEIIIDPEFRSAIPALSDEERSQLRDSILAEGIRDSLVVWDGHNIMLDGHNRYEIACDYDLSFNTVNIELEDRDAAFLWIIKNQLGRRNLTPQEMSYLRGTLYEREKQEHGGQVTKGIGQNDPSVSTAELIAKGTGVTERTVKRDAEYARAVNEIERIAGTAAKKAILSGDAKIHKQDMGQLAEIAQHDKNIAERVIDGEITVEQAKRELNTNKQSIERENTEENVLGEMPSGKFKTIVIDPPWPVQKIVRNVRPNQDVMDYKTMTLDEIATLPISDLADPEGCHVYLWSTHKFLPDALKLFEAWGVKYQCLMTWVKNVGITPFSWMYSTEHVLFGRIGSLQLNQLGLRLDFSAKVTQHSKKPDVFYERVIAASPEPRLEMFARNARDGFTVWGDES